VTQGNDPISRPQQQHSHLAVHGHIQSGNLHGNGQAEHAQGNRGVQGAQEGVAPEGIVHSTDVDGHQRQGDAQEVDR